VRSEEWREAGESGGLAGRPGKRAGRQMSSEAAARRLRVGLGSRLVSE
jgi:hypothetical protein